MRTPPTWSEYQAATTRLTTCPIERPTDQFAAPSPNWLAAIVPFSSTERRAAAA